MDLHFRTFGEGKPLVIVHGLFGSSDNWQTLGKRFAEKYKVYLVDLRNHGRSENTDEFSYELMAEDLHDLFTANSVDGAVLLGHSMGGKAAMAFANKYPDQLDGLIVADIGKKGYRSHHDQIIAGLKAIDVKNLDSRRDADDTMKEYVPEFGVRQFLLKNLYRNGKDGFGWRINIPVLEREMPEILRGLDEVNDVDLPTLFVRGGKSNYITDEDIPELAKDFPNSSVETMEGIGHWLHAEDPDGFYDVVTEFVDGLD